MFTITTRSHCQCHPESLSCPDLHQANPPYPDLTCALQEPGNPKVSPPIFRQDSGYKTSSPLDSDVADLENLPSQETVSDKSVEGQSVKRKRDSTNACVLQPPQVVAFHGPRNAFAGLQFHTIGKFDPSERDQIQKRIVTLGGKNRLTVHKNITHLVAKHSAIDVCIAADRLNAIIVTPAWIEECFERNMLIPIERPDSGCKASVSKKQKYDSNKIPMISDAPAAKVISLIDDKDPAGKPHSKRSEDPYFSALQPTQGLYRLDASGHYPKSEPLSDDIPAPDTVDKGVSTGPENEPVLCKEQQDLVDLICSGRNVFYTGSAGCGKSTVLKAFVKRLETIGRKVRIIAPTGKAALDINGSTTWTFAGWTPDHHKKPLDELKMGAHGKFVYKRLNAVDVLVIDEISMVENHHFERLNALMKTARANENAFGGVQLIVTGDFCQLPPVKPFQYCITCGRRTITSRDGTEYKCPQHGLLLDKDKWAFRSKAWEEAKFAHVNLTNIHRQSDETFIRILQKCRIGTPFTTQDARLLLDHPCNVENAVRLFPTREEVRRINAQEFNRLKTPLHKYLCYDHFQHNPEHRNLSFKGQHDPFDPHALTALRDHRFESKIELKEGMVVVLLVNLDLAGGLVNGSQGRIIRFQKHDDKDLPKASCENSHRNNWNQNGRDSSPQPAFPVEKLSGEHAAIREMNIKAFMKNQPPGERLWPVVHFSHNNAVRAIFADCTVNELGDDKPYSLLSRTQIPLTAAWALSIHKSQGMTLDRVAVDLARSFEEGQVYVALSRARSLEGLKVEGLEVGRGTRRAGGEGGNREVREFLGRVFGEEIFGR